MLDKITNLCRTLSKDTNEKLWRGVVIIYRGRNPVSCFDYEYLDGRVLITANYDNYMTYKHNIVEECSIDCKDKSIIVTIPCEVKLSATTFDGYGRFAFALEKSYAKTEVIFNPPATILYKDGEKYVSKCDSVDTFDEEKGLMLCLLKSHGYTYSDIERLLNSAKRFGDKK